MAFNTSYIVNPEIAAKITNKDELYAQGYFSGTSDTTYAFDDIMHGFVISNDSDESLTFEINGYEFEVKSGEVFENTFHPFMSVTIKTNGAFRAFAKGENGIAKGGSEHKIFPEGKTGAISTSGKYKGTGFQMMTDKAINYVGANGSPSDFEIWELDSYKKGVKFNYILSASPLASGDFSEDRDSDGYLIANLSSPLPVEIGKHYILVVHYTTTETARYLSTSSDTGNVDNVIRATGTNLSNDTGVQGKGFALGNLFYYDFKIGVETL